ncbi:hypothetical protein ASD65_09985 [Microbacterium sp. Root61]|uniref:PaaI family thioesterase n=1 Tax=Microbacterium sp. Root61 TaxID=1736570 RepID=UPI0006FF469E|nr:PaaI family thioesterase [Microbacterium sp. Root61]KRA24710.1 hypothetical protein ASD65_09985 [Microbacterium sp. Root61]
MSEVVDVRAGEERPASSPEAHAEQLRGAQALARAVRVLSDDVIRMPAGTYSEEFARRVQEISLEMQEHLRPSIIPWFYDDPRTARGRGESLRNKDELSDFNPVVPPIRLTLEDGEAHGTVVVGPAFTGPPGRVHGGTVATILDHAMGLLVSATARPSVTARLEIDYRGGAPIGQELQISARIKSADGRKTWVEAEIRVGDILCSRGLGLFIVPAVAPAS